MLLSEPVPITPKMVNELLFNKKIGIAICPCPLSLDYGHIVEYNKTYKCKKCGQVFTLCKK